MVPYFYSFTYSMSKRIPDYDVGDDRLYFTLNGREISARVDHSAPVRFNGYDMAGLTPDDMKIDIGEVTDAMTGEVIPCTNEIREAIAHMIHDFMVRAFE